MNNNHFPISHNIYNSNIEYPIQLYQNLNCFFFLMPQANQMSIMPFMNYYQYYPPIYYQNNSNMLLMNKNNDKKDVSLSDNYNNISLFNLLELNRFLSPFTWNNQLNLSSIASNQAFNLSPQNAFFLNKKRSNVLYEKEKEKIGKNIKAEEGVIQIKEIKEVTNNKKKSETTISSNERNIIYDNNSEPKEKTMEKVEKNIGCEKPKEEKIKKKKKRNKYKELLQDTLLEHIGEPKIINSINHLQIFKSNQLPISNKKNKKISKPKIKSLKDESIKNKNNKGKNKIKIKILHHQRKINHKITLKNNADILGDLQENKTKEKKEINSKLTKVIFHGENYENTKSKIDFMKYNFNLNVEEQYKTKKIITNYDQQHIDLHKINDNIYENSNDNSASLDEIEIKWSRKKFNGSNKELGIMDNNRGFEGISVICNAQTLFEYNYNKPEDAVCGVINIHQYCHSENKLKQELRRLKKELKITQSNPDHSDYEIINLNGDLEEIEGRLFTEKEKRIVEMSKEFSSLLLKDYGLAKKDFGFAGDIFEESKVLKKSLKTTPNVKIYRSVHYI